jgi:hypothetical protein
MSILENIDVSIDSYLNGSIKNPLLKKVIEEEITSSNNLKKIFKTFFSDIVSSANYDNKLNNLSSLIKNISNDTRNILKTQLCNSFIELSGDDHIFLIITMNENIKNIFELMANDESISQILRYLLSGLSIGINKDEYIIKCIDGCKIINKNISNSMVEEYIYNNGVDLMTNDKLLAYFIKYILENYNDDNIIKNVYNLISAKLMQVREQTDNLPLTNMSYAFEIYKLGKIIIDSKVRYVNKLICSVFTEINDAKIEYIVKSIHTCIMKNNYPQAQAILSIIFYLNSKNLGKFIEYYNKSLILRMNESDILNIEYNLWNINNDYNSIMSNPVLASYTQIINNIKYTNIINDDMTKIKIKNIDINMNKVRVTLLTENTNNKYDNIVHHTDIKKYIDGMTIYIENRSTIQHLNNNMEKSTIKFKTSMGSITCSLINGSILLHLKDKHMTIKELSDSIKINEDDLSKRLKLLIQLNIVIENNDIYKYVEPYGDVDCNVSMIENTKQDLLNEHVIERFSDVIMTIQSRIMKEVKPNKMNKLELERRVQEYMGDSYVRSIFYQQIDILKEKYYIKEEDSIIEYDV